MMTKILEFKGLDGRTAYNPTVPFQRNGEEHIGVRVESLDSESDSKTVFARKVEEDVWEIDESLKQLQLQDPTYVKIRNEIYVLGVRVSFNEGNSTWHQEIHGGDSLENLEHICSGPQGMKDIRLVELNDRVGVFTRPQGKSLGAGQIGYMEVGQVEELKSFSEDDWYRPPIIKGLFSGGQWGGVNQAINLGDDKIGVIGHVAHSTMDSRGLEKHYRGMSFVFNPRTRSSTRLKVIAQRSDFPISPSKRSPELDNIIFPAGIRNGFLYSGISDYCVGKKKIGNPFL